jgi:hypothetical protein
LRLPAYPDMMVSSRQRDNGRRSLSASFILSVLLHATLLPLLLWLLARSYVHFSPPPSQIASSTAIELERRVAPVHNPSVVPHPHVAQQPQPRPVQAALPPPRELARLRPNSPAQPPERSRVESAGQDLAAQERTFAAEAQRLHEESNPLAVATAAANASSYQRTMIDASGKYESQERTYAWLTPMHHWFDGAMSCYYVHYVMSTNQGGGEDGNIPWPICYPRNDDRMLPLNRPHMLPIPIPPAGYVVSADTYLTPFLREIYDQRPH